MKSRATFFSTILLLILLLSIAPISHAQVATGIDLSPDIDDPLPGQSVTITARSYSTDINAATVTWTVGGKVLKRGVGATILTVTAPLMGKTLTVSVNAVSPDGATFDNNIVLTSGSVDMIVEPEAYVMPLFAGKFPVAYQNTVKVTAIPHLANAAGVEFDPKTLVYQWQQNSSAIEGQSGYGKQAVVIQGTLIPRPYQIMVNVSTRDGSQVASQAVTVAPGAPSILFYRNDALYGPLYNKAITDSVYVGSEREVNVLAAPLGFNMPTSGLGDVSMDWLINGVLHTELSQNLSITLRAPEGAAGSSNINLTASNSVDFLQSATAGFQAMFSATPSTSAVQF